MTLARGFSRPDALLDPQVLWRLAPYGGAEALQTGNESLLKRLVDPDVFHRMAQGAAFPGATGSYQDADLLVDLNDGLFVEIKQPHPTIDLYRRDLQRTYVNLLLSAFSNAGPSEFKAALRTGINDLFKKLEQAGKNVRDPPTRAHLKDLSAAIGG